MFLIREYGSLFISSLIDELETTRHGGAVSAEAIANDAAIAAMPTATGVVVALPMRSLVSDGPEGISAFLSSRMSTATAGGSWPTV